MVEKGARVVRALVVEGAESLREKRESERDTGRRNRPERSSCLGDEGGANDINETNLLRPLVLSDTRRVKQRAACSARG